ncbi:MAG TPA: helix-turn-helix domain-containing protein [Verrucomicrobiae bacterium]|nr:helix-turn-helix domain-containing protein [Verrucomicrobiae bacterium]
MPSSKRTRLTERQMLQIARALAEPRRYRIVKELGQHAEATPCTEIQSRHAISAATLSHHLKELETAGLIRIEREGKFAYLTLQREMLAAYVEQLGQL